MTPQQRRSQVVTIFSLYLLFFLPLWVVLPALNEYVLARRCLAMHGIFASTGPVCGATDVSVSGQNWSTWVMLACNVPSLLMVLPLGRLTDLHGRRPVMLLCLGTQCFGSAGMLAVCLLRLPLVWFMPPYVINGLGGGSYTLQTVAMASLADVAENKRQKERQLARATATYYACGAVGPLLGGYMSSAKVTLLPRLHGAQYQLAYMIFFITNAMALVAAALCFQETLPTAPSSAGALPGAAASKAAPRSVAGWARGLYGALVTALKPIRSRAIGLLAAVFCLLYSTVNSALSGLIVTYAKLKVFSMSDELVGWFIAVPWLIRAMAAALLFPLLLEHLSALLLARQRPPGTERHAEHPLLEGSAAAAAEQEEEERTRRVTCEASLWLIRAGACLSVTVFSLFGLASTTPVLFLLCSVEGLAAIWDAGCAVMLSNLRADGGRNPPEDTAGALAVSPGGASDTEPAQHKPVGADQGALMGLRALLQTSMAVFGPLVFNCVYSSTVKWDRPFTFYMLAVCCALALGISFMIRRRDF